MSAEGVLGRDFDQLHEGEGFATVGRTITEADLVSFSSLTGDWHPQHADASWAAQSQFGERIAHGMLVLSYAVGLAPIDPERVVALRSIDDVAFKRPVRIGDTIHLEGRIEAVRPIGDGLALVVMMWRIVNERGELAARARVSAVWRGGDGGADADGVAADGVAAKRPTPARTTAAAEPPFEEVYL